MLDKYKLPNELSLHIFSFLRPKDLCRVSQVNKEIQKLVNDNHIWSQFLRLHGNKIIESKKEICKRFYLKLLNHFAISPVELNSLNYPLCLDQLYIRLRRLNKFLLKNNDLLRQLFYADKKNRPLILRCCSDDLRYIDDLTQSNEAYVRNNLLDVAVIAGSTYLSKALFDYMIVKDPHKKVNDLLGLSAQAGNFEMAKFLFENYPTLIVTEDMLNKSNSAGCLELIHLLLEKNPKLKPTQTTFNCAASSGNIDALILLRKFNPSLEFTASTLQCAITASVNSDQIASYILEQNKELIPNYFILHHAAFSGSVEFITLLLKRNPFLKPDHSTLANAQHGGNQHLIAFLRENYNDLVNYRRIKTRNCI